MYLKTYRVGFINDRPHVLDEDNKPIPGARVKSINVERARATIYVGKHPFRNVPVVKI